MKVMSKNTSEYEFSIEKLLGREVIIFPENF